MQPELRYSGSAAQTGLSAVRNKVLRNTYWMLGLTMIPTLIGASIGMSTNFVFLAQAPLLGRW
jgi:modulator of FtsH protease